VVFGAYVRLNNAGLGCPDWPGCYGHATVPQSDTMRAAAQAKFPGAGLEARKAWIEMIHRYLAGALGLLILALAVLAWRHGTRPGPAPGAQGAPWLQTVLVVLVAFQAALGMWTVTLLLKPAIVTLHLVGGMLTLSLLAWLALRELQWWPLPRYEIAARLRPWAVLAGCCLCQIVLAGGSARTTPRSLPDFRPATAPSPAGGLCARLSRACASWACRPRARLCRTQALNAIHWTHRLGAVLACSWLGAWPWRRCG
jgi:cytochrome c oxidase assembly protein subunit 15